MQTNIEIVLVNTQLPENLGSVARGMLNFNFEKLRIVKPKFTMSNEKIIPLSAGAEKVLKNSKIFNSFSDSINDLNYVIGTTNRTRAIKKKEMRCMHEPWTKRQQLLTTGRLEPTPRTCMYNKLLTKSIILNTSSLSIN